MTLYTKSGFCPELFIEYINMEAENMKFDKESGIVKVWVNLVQNGTYTRDQVPKMFNLQEVVADVLDEQAAEDVA